MKIAILANNDKYLSAESERLVRDYAVGLGIEMVDVCAADVIIALGGDGTILNVVSEHPNRPILGLNIGGLGYLASVEKRDFKKALELLVEQRFRVSRRTMISIVPSRTVEHSFSALNDIVFKSVSGHPSVLDMSINGGAVTKYLADGLIVSTPTGSTAYSLSAGGPVVAPDSQSIVITPISPHALGVRSLVIKDTCEIKLTNRRRRDGQEQCVAVYCDARHVATLSGNESIVVKKADSVAALVELEGYDPYEVLSRKLGWRGMSLSD
jgi:NAD+ kinase